MPNLDQWSTDQVPAARRFVALAPWGYVGPTPRSGFLTLELMPDLSHERDLYPVFVDQWGFDLLAASPLASHRPASMIPRFASPRLAAPIVLPDLILSTPLDPEVVTGDKWFPMFSGAEHHHLI